MGEESAKSGVRYSYLTIVNVSPQHSAGSNGSSMQANYFGKDYLVLNRQPNERLKRYSVIKKLGAH
jgi:hypothetical protein